MRNIARLFLLPWYLIGWAVHVYLGLFAPEVYRPLGSTAILPRYAELWNGSLMPYISLWAIVLAAFELAVGCLLLAPRTYFKAGLILSIGFNLFLVQMGLGYHCRSAAQSFCMNRLPNLLFAAIQAPLLFGAQAGSVPALFRSWITQRPIA